MNMLYLTMFLISKLCFIFKRTRSTFNATAMTARRSFDVAGKIAFVLWRHGQRRNGTMPTKRVASLCLLSHRSAWIPRARSSSRIKWSRTRLPVGVFSLMCEKTRDKCIANVLISLQRFTGSICDTGTKCVTNLHPRVRRPGGSCQY